MDGPGGFATSPTVRIELARIWPQGKLRVGDISRELIVQNLARKSLTVKI
jgi:hypothetical protein